MEYQSKTSAVNTDAQKWVYQYSDDLYNWALFKVGDSELAQDLVQDTFLAALKQLQKFNGKSKVKTWLFGILNNKIMDHFREQYRVGKTSVLENAFNSDGSWNIDHIPENWSSNTDNLMDDTDFVEQLNRCKDKLPNHWSLALQYKYLREEDPKVICQELNISTTNYWQIIHRAKLQLRHCIKKNWGRHE
jgi:RNA polymerase sigma-70 factor (ECF subfamily)